MVVKDDKTIMAYDPGFGNIKVAMNGIAAAVENVIAPAHDIGSAAKGLRMAKRATEVELTDGSAWLVGGNALSWGEPVFGMDWSNLFTKERRVAFYAAVAMLLEEPANIELVIGLPVPLLMSDGASKSAFGNISAMKGSHKFRVDGEENYFSIDSIKVLAQPVGAYYDWLLNFELEVVGDPEARVAVVDVGQNTVDMYALQNGRVDPRFIGGSKSGARRLLARLARDIGSDPVELMVSIVRGKLQPGKEDLASWLAEVMDDVEGTLGNLARFHKVILTGGGAALLGKGLVDAVAERGGEAYTPPNMVASNVLGLWKWGSSR